MKLKLNGRTLISVIILVSIFLNPILGLNLINQESELIDEAPLINPNLISAADQYLSNPGISNPEGQFDDVRCKYDYELKDYLSDLPLQYEDQIEEVRVIFSFTDGTSKSDRETIICSVLNYSEIIYNYNIIPAVYIKCNTYELLEKEAQFRPFASIEAISKSKTYESPVIRSDLPRSSSLSKDNFPNWWVPAVDGDNVGGLDGSGVRVAVIDSGVYDHPDINYNPTSTTARNFDSETPDASAYDDILGHGTHCAGIIAGNGGGSSGTYRGIAPGATIINARAGNSFTDADLIAAIEWCVGSANADIISMSLGGGYPSAHDALTMAISSASDEGVIVVAAAGNGGPGYFSGGSPGSGVDVITVGATDKNNNLASFSSGGPTYSFVSFLDVVAPGVDIISTNAFGGVYSNEHSFTGNYFNYTLYADYIPSSGTSMACPMVAGALAILKQKYPSLTPEAARNALIKGATVLSDEKEAYFTRSGAGIINISASLAYLDAINTTYADVNNTAIFLPDNLPVEPFDLLNFPGDHQKFNITIISGKGETYDITVPNPPDGVTLTFDKTQIVFDNASVGFVGLDIKIDKDAEPGIRNFLINLNKSAGGDFYDSINVSLDIRLPEYRILMDSFHGLNDWNPSVYDDQIGYYEAMSDLSDINISIAYGMKYWTPDYDENTDNSILTSERLSQYDLVVLQTPILPYAPIEITALNEYFNEGGNLLLLGDNYQSIGTSSINNMLSELGVNIVINDETVMNIELHGLGGSIYSQSVTAFNEPTIFNGVSKYLWYSGCSFATSGNSESIATLNGKTVAAAYNGTLQGKGKLIALGGTNWIHSYYTTSSYYSDHNTFLLNLMDYLLPKNNVSIDIGLRSERVNDNRLNITVYAKNQTTDAPIDSTTLNSSLVVTVEHQPTAYSTTVLMGSTIDGISSNYTYDLPIWDEIPYNITVNLTIGSDSYVKTSKILRYRTMDVPQITSLFTAIPSISRGSGIGLGAVLDKTTYNATAYLTMTPYLNYRAHKTINQTLPLSYDMGNYVATFYPGYADPAGLTIFYIVSKNATTKFINPNSPRKNLTVNNGAPTINEELSFFSTDSYGPVFFENTHTESSVFLHQVKQGTKITLDVVVSDTSNEDSVSELEVYATLIHASIVGSSIYTHIYPSEINSTKLTPATIDHVGSYFIPSTIQVDTLGGLVEVSTVAYGPIYYAVLQITVFDTEGESTTFSLFLELYPEAGPPFPWALVLLIIAIALIGIAASAIIYSRVKKAKEVRAPGDSSFSDSSVSSPNLSNEILGDTENFCPYCGISKGNKLFCVNCGKKYE